jgi:D-glycero-alpha-D-manno-heptose-7-phosphate kinase
MRTVVSRAPGRISLAGGGTDLPAFYERHGGAVVSFAIPLAANASICERPTGLELVSIDHDAREMITAERYTRRMRHPFLSQEFVTLHKAVAWHFGLDRARISTAGDLPFGAGLGSSGAVCAALVGAAAAYLGEAMDRATIAATAARVEMGVLRRPCGKQDPYASAFGGLNLIEFLRDGGVWVSPVAMPLGARAELTRHLIVLSNGSRRNGAEPLGELARRLFDDETCRDLAELREIAYLVRAELERGDLIAFGALMHRAWETKRRLHGKVSTPRIDRLYAMARDVGAWGGKLLGAGVSGAMLFVCPPEHQSELRAVMATQGWRATAVAIEDAGVTVSEPLVEEVAADRDR